MPLQDNDARRDTPPDVKKRAMIVLGITLAMAVAAWFGLNHAADVGSDRLQAYDRARAACNAKYAVAKNANDSIHVDESAISEVLDNGVSGAPKRCADLSKPPANARN